MLRKLAPGDVVTVTRIDRLARSTFDLFGIVKRIVDEGQFFRIQAYAAAHDVASNQNTREHGEQMTAASCRAFGIAFRARVVSWQDQLELLRANGQRVFAWGA
jgi:hypothetical protein